MRRQTLAANHLFAWAKLNGVEFNNIHIKTNIPASDGSVKGAGLVSANDARANEDGLTLMSVPQELVLTQERVHRYAAIDKHLKLVLDAAGAFGRITNASPDFDGPISVTNPHTDYVKLLPQSVLLPTFYTDEEKELLFGTSLQDALDQKLRSLEREFDQLHETTQGIAWCQQYWWDEDSGRLQFEDWMLVDALYRSRALEMPGAGHSMVPCIDMANHASGDQTIALYETDAEGRAILQIRDDKVLTKDEEVTITYGDEKGACEMIFSYGFLDLQMGSAKAIFLDLDIPDDDPLRLAKKTANKTAPGVKLFIDSDQIPKWESDYIWWACVNEEDGLNFRVTQQNDGNRQLEVLWKDQPFDPSQLRKALEDDPKWDIFRLRALVMLQERIGLQLSHLEASEDLLADSQGQAGVRQVVWALICRLRALEGNLLTMYNENVEEQKKELLTHETVIRYLETAQAEVDIGIPADADEDDFS